MRRLAALGLIFCFGFALPAPAEDDGRIRILINDQWQFQMNGAGDRLDEGNWNRVTLPHTWNAGDSRDKLTPYRRGMGHYRRQLEVDESMAGRTLYLYFEGANQVAEVYVNGQRAAKHVGGYSAFAVDITALVIAGADNVVEVRVDNRHDNTTPPLNADFTFYGGIYRNVWLLALADVHFAIDAFAATRFEIRTDSVSEGGADVSVTGVLENRSRGRRQVTVELSLIDPKGKVAGRQSTELLLEAGVGASERLAEFSIDAPALWSPESPNLYRVVAVVTDADGVLDRLDYPLGLRWFDVDARNGFSLNGKPYRLVGTNRHQDHAGYGNAMPDALHRSDLQRIKDDGFNFLRLAHYPQDPAVLDAADELGLIIWEETPVVNLIDMSPDFAANAERMVREMIRQHRHHPSIVFWGYMNEVTLRKPNPVPDGYNDAVVALAERLEAVVKEEDATRPTVMALSRDEVFDAVPLESITDILAFNLYFGWYYGDFDDFGRFLDDYRDEHPDRPLMVSEYGAGSDERVHARAPVAFDFSIEYQQRFHESSLDQILDRPWLIGSAVWNQFDFGSSHRQDTKFGINQKGLWYFDRKPKDIAHYYRARLKTEPVIHIAARDWPARAGSRNRDSIMPVKVYSNADEVELLANGSSQGHAAVMDGIAAWNVPLDHGRNTLVARSGSSEDSTVIDFDDRRALFTSGFGNRVLAINVGAAEQVVDYDGQVWEADREYDGATWGYAGGEASRGHHRIFGTADDPLYQTQRGGSFVYRFEVPDGVYCVTLKGVRPDSYGAWSRQQDVAAVHGDGFEIDIGDDPAIESISALAVREGRCPDDARGGPSGDRGRPNIVFILADDIGYGDVGAYGGSLETPNIDALARAGMRFTDAHSPAALCAPSRFSLLTGSYPYRNGRPGGSWDINFSSGFNAGADHLAAGKHITVGEILQSAGYRTGFIGKLHLGGDVFDLEGRRIGEKDRLSEMDFSRGIADSVNEHGFDYSFALASGIQHEPYAYFENGRYAPVDKTDAPDNSSTVLRMNGRYRIGDNGVSEIVEAGDVPARTDRRYDSSQAGLLLTRKALEFVDRHLESNRRSGTSQPFALYFSSQAIHVPHTPPVDFDGDPTTLDEPVSGVTGGATSDMIIELDRQVGALVNRLAEAGILDDTLIFFTSDNGALPPAFADYGTRSHDSNGPWRGYKSSVYEGGHRVPFIARWGDGSVDGSRIAPGSISDVTIMNHDWVATAYDLVGEAMAPDQAMDSASLLPLLVGESNAPVHEFVLYQAGYARLGAIREGPWILVVDENREASELYNLDTDPGQTSDLVDDPDHRARAARLLGKYLLHNDRDDNTFTEPRTTSVLQTPMTPGR